MPEPRPTATLSIAPADRDLVHRDLLSLGGADEAPGPYEAWRIRLSDQGSQARAILYNSGKLVVSGQAPAFDQVTGVADAVGKRVPPKAKPATSPPSEAPPETEPHIGTDEAGKGDFFGPMVTAGVYVDARTAQILRTLGVRDSKAISDRELRGLAKNIRDVTPEGARVVLLLAPKRYNELYKQMRSEGKNLNTMLAWTHTRVIEDLIKSGLKPTFILSDQFGDKR
ncbi:MAG TPA: hypothetical protein VM674_02215, partial [Candidatus Acidoferrum sp.]|nr:hypothetical protein [Candidatus Acidoferrum sp.]